jgi:putative tricarboxylic transport membrane protein
MGLFGVGEILVALEREAATSVIATRLRELMPTREEARRSVAPIARGTAIGFLLGLVPGIGAVVPTIMSYVAERKLSATPEKFGTGMIEGVAGPETANNAYANAALVPLFTLGIPASPTIAVLLGAFMMNGLTPGPFLFKEKPDFVWGVIASLYVGNLILVVLNLPLVGIWVKLLKTPRSILFSLVLAFTVVGAFVTSNSVFDIGVLLAFGVVGYLFTKMGIPIAPMAFTVILGPLTENALRQALAMSGGELDVLARGWISTGLLALAAVVLAWSVFAAARRARP